MLPLYLDSSVAVCGVAWRSDPSAAMGDVVAELRPGLPGTSDAWLVLETGSRAWNYGLRARRRGPEHGGSSPGARDGGRQRDRHGAGRGRGGGDNDGSRETVDGGCKYYHGNGHLMGWVQLVGR